MFKINNFISYEIFHQRIILTHKHFIHGFHRLPQEAAEATGNLVGNKIVETIAKAALRSTDKDAKHFTQITEPTGKSKEIYIPPEITTSY